MKSVKFSEDQLGDLSQLAQALFQDEQDPRSLSYVRILKRPRISWLRIGMFVGLPILLAGGLYWLLTQAGLSGGLCLLLVFAVLAVYAAIFLKRAVICCVRIYQRYAPDAIRNKCRFEPSCSEYMILAIEKYGLWKGGAKGIHRLRRCNLSDGGYDYP